MARNTIRMPHVFASAAPIPRWNFWVEGREVRVSLGIWLVLSAFLCAYSQPKDPVDQNLKRQETPPCGSTEDTIPNGIAVVLPPGEKGYKSGNLVL